MDMELKKIGARRVLFVRHTGPYEESKVAWEKLCEWGVSKGVMEGVSEFCGLCHDDPQVTAPEKIRYDACLVTDAEINKDGEVGLQEIESGEYATYVHKGSYSGLLKVYLDIYGDWIPQLGREPKESPCVEVYLNDPRDTPEQELLTEIQIPLV